MALFRRQKPWDCFQFVKSYDYFAVISETSRNIVTHALKNNYGNLILDYQSPHGSQIKSIKVA